MRLAYTFGISVYSMISMLYKHVVGRVRVPAQRCDQMLTVTSKSKG